MKNKRLTRLFFGILMVILSLCMSSGTAMAAKRENTWFKTKKDRVFYYDENGEISMDSSRAPAYQRNGYYKITI